jgi:cytochrome c oxidase subunit II
VNHAVLSPAGPLSAEIAQLFWVFVGVAAVVYLVVIAFLLAALRRRNEANTRTAVRVVSVAVGITSIVLLGLGVSDFFAQRVIAAMPQDPLRVRVTAHQWWWEIEYADGQPSRRVRTANELHVPTGRPVELELTADDVIHSFWVPSLQGKKDLLPGYTTRLDFIASRAGVYEGQCAEFCGFQHAHMAIDVIALAPDEYSRWYEAQLASPPEPTNPAAHHGREVFMGSSCVMCHNIQGTDASGSVGPDLTHVASRRRLAAGTLPNTPSNLAGWIRDPQGVKPGTHMPATQLSGEDLAALTSYLSELR